MATTTPATRNSFSIPSIVAVIAAIWSFMANSATGAMGLAVVAILFGILGVIISFSPVKRGGIASTFGIAAGAIGIIAALIRGIMWLLNAG
jgi:hypothetical protein